jgi:L-amino acid N-acyltransferase YncA
MSLESALEIYPRTAKLKSGAPVTLRPLVETDHKALVEFYKALPSDDLIFLKERIADPKVVKSWCKNIDDNQVLRLLALMDKKIVGVCSLHQDQGGWKRHIARLNVHALPQQRGKGIGRLLITEMIEIARQSGLTYLEAEFFAKQENAIRMFGLLGFSNLLQLPEYVKDMQSVTHDYILMGMKLITEEEYAGMG